MRLSIFAKIFLVFMALVSPLYLVSIYISVDGQNRAKRNVYDSIIKNVDFYVSTIEQSLHSIALA